MQRAVADHVARVRVARAAGSGRRRRRRAAAQRDAPGAVVAPVPVAHAARARRLGAAVLVLPLVHRAAASVHEEVAHRRRFKAQLLRYRHLHLFRRPFGFLSPHLHQSTPIKLCSHSPDTLKMACSVRLCRSVNTRRGFFGDGCSGGACSSLRLHTTAAVKKTKEEISQVPDSPNRPKVSTQAKLSQLLKQLYWISENEELFARGKHSNNASGDTAFNCCFRARCSNNSRRHCRRAIHHGPKQEERAVHSSRIFL